MILKDRIKKLRKELDLTQQKFAGRLGVQRNTIAMYEMGKNVPSEAIILSICREFNVNEEWLREGTGEMFIKQSPDEPFINIISVLTSLDEDDWKLLFRTAFALVKEKEVMQ